MKVIVIAVITSLLPDHTGTLPIKLGGTTTLRQLDLRGNRLDGELPLGVIRLKAMDGYTIQLRNNKGFSLPKKLDILGGDVIRLDLSFCSLHGKKAI